MIIRFLSRLFRRSISTPRNLHIDQRQSLVYLTPREKEVSQLWTMSNTQIARQLYISPETVRCHWKSIYLKLGVHSKEEVGKIFTHGQTYSSQS